MNDVVLAICGGSLRRYLEAKGELPRESLLAMAPISVRTGGQQGTGGNQVSAMVVPLHTEIGDPVERLHAVQTGTLFSLLNRSVVVPPNRSGSAGHA